MPEHFMHQFSLCQRQILTLALYLRQWGSKNFDLRAISFSLFGHSRLHVMSCSLLQLIRFVHKLDVQIYTVDVLPSKPQDVHSCRLKDDAYSSASIEIIVAFVCNFSAFLQCGYSPKWWRAIPHSCTGTNNFEKLSTSRMSYFKRKQFFFITPLLRFFTRYRYIFQRIIAQISLQYRSFASYR